MFVSFGQCGVGGMMMELIGATLPPAGYAYEEYVSSPHTMTPNAPPLVATCGPLLQLPCGAPLFTSHDVRELIFSGGVDVLPSGDGRV